MKGVIEMFRLPKGWNGWVIVVLALIAIGFVVGVISNPGSFLLPIIVLGGIFLLYKYPPSFLSGARPQPKRTQVQQSRAASAKTKNNRPRSKTVPFRVIEGGKDNDDIPKYH